MVQNVRAGKLPEYKHTDGQMYSADVVRNLVQRSFETDDVEAGHSAIDALIGIAKQAGYMENLEPTPQQVQKTLQDIAQAKFKRPELDPKSGSMIGKVLGMFFEDPEYGRFVARRPQGIADAIGLAEYVAKGIEAGDENAKLKDENAKLKAQLEENGQKVADYEKKATPARAGVTRKPSTADKPATEKSTSELEDIVRKQAASGQIRWGG
jgi:hypothetical protein